MDPYFQRRFNLLYIIEKRTIKEGLYLRLERYLKKNMQRIAFSVLAGFILTFITGLIDVAQDFQTTAKYYGWPFQWLRQPIDAKVVEFRYFEFVSDLIIISLVIYVIISLYEHYFVKGKT